MQPLFALFPLEQPDSRFKMRPEYGAANLMPCNQVTASDAAENLDSKEFCNQGTTSVVSTKPIQSTGL
jgi:hypothetical protein